MDAKTLKVGQDVFILCGPYISWGKVVKVNESGAMVKLARNAVPFSSALISFDTNGKFGDPWHPEGGPWELDDKPFEERLAACGTELRKAVSDSFKH